MARTNPYGESTGEGNPTDGTKDLTSYCPPDGVIDTLRGKYAISIVTHLGEAGALRYGEIKDRIGAPSDATMSRRLEQLTDEGLIDRHHYDEIPPRVEYSLSTAGRELEEHLEGLLRWAASVDTR